MKKTLIIFALGLVTFQSIGQIIDPKESVKSGATDRGNSRIQGGVDKGLDKIESGVGSFFKKKNKKPDAAAETTGNTDKADNSSAKFVIVINYKHSDHDAALNAQRVYNLVLSMQDQSVTYYTSDREDSNTSSAAHRVIQLMGLNELWSKMSGTASAYIVDVENKTIVKTLKTSTADKELTKALHAAIAN